MSILKYLRVQPFDTSSEEGRNAERYRLALWSVIANISSRGIAMLVMVLSVRWTLPYLGEERFGVWMTIASFVGMLIFLDLGVGNALTNHVAMVAADGNKAPLTRTVSGGLGLLFLIGLVSSIMLCLVFRSLPWESIIKVRNPLINAEIQQALFFFSILFGVSIFTSGVQKIFAGLQRSFEAHAASAVGSMLSLIVLWWAARNNADIPVLLLATLGCQSINGFLLLWLLRKRGIFRLQGIGSAIHAEKKTLLKIGGLFFVLQLGTMVGWGADSLIISSTLGATQVAVYSVTQRLFQFVSAPLAMVNAPLWSSYADAHVRGDHAFVRRTLKKSMFLTAGMAIAGGGLLVFFSQELVAWWTKGDILVPMAVVGAFFIWTLCESVGNSFAMMMNGCGVVREQVIAVMLLTVLALPTKILFINYFGISGMIFSYAALYCAVVVYMYGYVFRAKLIEKLGQ
jgi:O-antigen/teichoic acid export membrane protein